MIRGPQRWGPVFPVRAQLSAGLVPPGGLPAPILARSWEVTPCSSPGPHRSRLPDDSRVRFEARFRFTVSEKPPLPSELDAFSVFRCPPCWNRHHAGLSLRSGRVLRRGKDTFYSLPPRGYFVFLPIHLRAALQADIANPSLLSFG